MKDSPMIKEIMQTRFGKDSLVAVATISDNVPYVRTVDALYIDGGFYSITYALSKKMKHIKTNPNVAVSGEWFSGHGIARNLGWVRNEENSQLADKLRAAFASWYENGDVDETDTNTVILEIKLTDGILFAEGKRFEVDFAAL